MSFTKALLNRIAQLLHLQDDEDQKPFPEILPEFRKPNQ